MTRNTEQHFAENPVTIDIQRSKFDRTSQHKTTMNAGELVPIFIDEVLPGDGFNLTEASAIRMSTPIFPVMDNAQVDTYYFFVPNRLVWNHWREFCGENRTTHWEQPVEYEIPQITAPTGGWAKGTIADYMGIPTGVSNISVNALPFRAYAMIWNEWFRDENLKDPAMVNLDETTVTGTNSGNYVINAQLGAKPLPVAKNHDYFTSCLPSPQKGPAVKLPLGKSAPLMGSESVVTGYPTATGLLGHEMSIVKNTATGGDQIVADNAMGLTNMTGISLEVNLANATAATINELRQAFAIQRLFEKDARGGTRYIEMLKAHFGVTSPDARQQRPEYLGGVSNPINVAQVIQTSSTDNTSPQGNAAAYSLTNNMQHIADRSFTEHGYIIGVACIRISQHSYQQGIERFWNRKKRFDFYYPALANIGEMAVLNKEIYATGTTTDDEAFGYQEAWGEYRYKPDRVSSAFRSNYQTSLDSWHYADDYSELPHLSSEWIDEGLANIDRTLAVSSEVEDQFICDFLFKVEATRPMPLYSVPGLLDHH